VKSITLWKIDPNSENCTPIQLAGKEVLKTLDDLSKVLPGGVYTTLRTFHHHDVLYFDKHISRLEESASLINKPITLDRNLIRELIRQIINDISFDEVRVRITVDLEDEIGSIYISTENLQTPSDETYKKGAKAVTYPDHRNNPKAKLTRHLAAASTIRQHLDTNGLNEILFVDESGLILEGLSSNFFAIRNRTVITANEGVLVGTIRAAALDIIRNLGWPIDFVGLSKFDLSIIDESFITSTSRGILPIVEIDQQVIGKGTPGPLTKILMEEYEDWIEEKLEPI
jgi:branched-chain amino acid aminotransferase